MVGPSAAPTRPSPAEHQDPLAFFARDMPLLPIADAVAFLAAMDLSKPVRDITLQAGERLLGFRTETESPFKLFFARRGASAHASGINTARRGPVHFVVRTPVRALESFTTGTKDTWTATTPGQRVGVAPPRRSGSVRSSGHGDGRWRTADHSRSYAICSWSKLAARSIGMTRKRC